MSDLNSKEILWSDLSWVLLGGLLCWKSLGLGGVPCGATGGNSHPRQGMIARVPAGGVLRKPRFSYHLRQGMIARAAAGVGWVIRKAMVSYHSAGHGSTTPAKGAIRKLRFSYHLRPCTIARVPVGKGDGGMDKKSGVIYNNKIPSRQAPNAITPAQAQHQAQKQSSEQSMYRPGLGTGGVAPTIEAAFLEEASMRRQPPRGCLLRGSVGAETSACHPHLPEATHPVPTIS